MYSFLRVSLYAKDNSKINQAKYPGKKFIKTKINKECCSKFATKNDSED